LFIYSRISEATICNISRAIAVLCTGFATGSSLATIAGTNGTSGALRHPERELLGQLDVCAALTIALKAHYQNESAAKWISHAVAQVAYDNEHNQKAFG
jgi:hypothetical protein